MSSMKQEPEKGVRRSIILVQEIRGSDIRSAAELTKAIYLTWIFCDILNDLAFSEGRSLKA